VTNATTKKAIFAAIALGFIGAAFAYFPYLGLREVPYLCPVCPHITALGNPYLKFATYTAVLGTANALVFSAIALGVVALTRALRQRE
jgi:hypothetical protein